MLVGALFGRGGGLSVDPLEIGRESGGEFYRDDLGNLVGVQGAEAGFQGGVEGTRGFEEDEGFGGLFLSILPDVDGGDAG